MSRRPRKSSTCVTLVLIGTAALAGCSDSSTSGRRAQYATKEECLADWGDPADCERQETTGSNGARTHYYGHYGGTTGGGYGGYASGAGREGTSSGHSISHGGFGTHSGSSSS
jgi:hypothetical protein